MALTKNISCHEAVALVSDYLEGALSRRDVRRLERHLSECEACTAYLDQMRVTIALTGTVSPDDLTDEALARLVDVFEKYQRDEIDE
ncbi:MAG: zf-HC2 domain-containing protein [Acidimicrobiales bacterium]